MEGYGSQGKIRGRRVFMAEILSQEKTVDADLQKVERESAAKQLRHRLDEYIAIILGVGSVLFLWFLQAMGLY